MSHPSDLHVDTEALAEYTEPIIQRSPNPYDALPEPIKGAYSEREYMWLSNDQKKRIIEMECEPDVTE
jgi:hypothetical protein